MSQLKLTSCLAKWNLGVWGIQANQPLDRFHPSGWQIPPTQLWAPITGTCYLFYFIFILLALPLRIQKTNKKN